LTVQAIKNAPSRLVLQSEAVVRKGDYLSKINYGSSGKKIKFFRVCEDNVLRWGSKESDLKNPAKKHTIYLNEVKAVVYGKKSEAFTRSSNKALVPWFCLTLKLQNRTLDLYLRPDQITYWMIGLSVLVKKQSPQSACLKPGHLLWRRAKMIGIAKITQIFMDKKKNVQFKALAQAMLALKREMMLSTAKR